MTDTTSLVAERFLLREGQPAVDLASGDRVLVRIRPSRDPDADQRWAGRCEHFVRLWHAALCPLLDYGAHGPRQRFEAWRSDGAWAGSASAMRECLHAAEGYLRRCGCARVSETPELHCLNAQPVLLPDLDLEPECGLRSPSLMAAPVAVDHCGIRFDAPACAFAIADTFAESDTQPAVAFSVWDPESGDVAWAVRSVARLVRAHGVMPVTVSMLPLARAHLARRSVCLLSRATAAQSWRAWLLASLWSNRGVALVCAEPEPSRLVVSFGLPARSHEELLASLEPCGAAAALAGTIRRAARQAAGSPSRFARALMQATARARLVPVDAPRRAAIRASEPPAEYHAAAQAAPEGPPPVAWPVTGELVTLRNRMRRAVAQIDRGRHVTGHRALRQAVGGLSRRHDYAHVALGTLDLVRLHLRRGQLKEATAGLAVASDAAARIDRHDLLAQIAILSAAVALNELRLQDAESLLRTARTAAEGLGEPELATSATCGLARCLFWRGRYTEAGELLAALRPRDGDARAAVRLAMARARLAVGAGDLVTAMSAADRGVSLARNAAPELLAPAAVTQAFCHLAVGDFRAVAADVAEALGAARRAHRPLCAITARLLQAETERRCGRAGSARSLAQRLGRLRGLPALLRARAALLADLARGGDEQSTLVRHVRLTGLEALALYAPSAGPALPARHVIALLECCQPADNDVALLVSVCERLRGLLDAAAVAFITRDAAGLSTVAASGGRPPCDLAERVEALGGAILPHAMPQTIAGGAPVRYAGRIVGTLVARWLPGASVPSGECGALMTAAATAAAPALAMISAERRQAHERVDATGLLGVSAGIETVRQAIARAASAPFPVLIEGESGSGKELVARAIHRQSPRRDRPLCTVNCAALPDELVESELFGHLRGAFTGAAAERVGMFEAAHQGTLFLDEIGELSLRAQAKVLRAVQEGELRRVGENASRRVDTRLVAATNRNLREEAAAGRFRADLVYRLDVIRIVIPPLRERREDVAVLADVLWRGATTRLGSRATLAAATLACLARYDWPGNVRELQNVLAALAVRAPRSGIVSPAALPPALTASEVRPARRLDEARRAFEGEFVRAALARAGGQRVRAAEELGVTRQGLTKIIARHGLN